ncbi:MAG: GldG family protein [Treponema sp.]|uniref:GldG family protein n=1 Tax=Treponema sp. TaxID=166 RepID=UPI00298E5552|nr:GldG family protein [Treponema sp.]MCR5386590.1 GldG family protein [Treponema sp.]
MKIKFPLVKKDLLTHVSIACISALLLFITAFVQFFGFQRFFIAGFGSSDLSSLFSLVPYVYSLIIPLLVLICSDSSVEDFFPFSSFKIIVSKLASIFILVVFITIPLFVIPVCVNIFGKVESAQVITGFLGLALYAFTAISFCLLLNEIFSVKPLFLSVSIVFLLVINSLVIVPYYANCNNFFTSLFNFVCFTYHFDSFKKGIVDTRDLFFYLISASVFILLACYADEKKRGRIFSKGRLKNYCSLLVLITIFAFLDSSRLYTRLDFTKDKQFSVSKYTKKTLSSVSDPVLITYYRSKELVSRYPQVNDVYDYLKICAKENKKISLKLADANKDENQKILELLNVMPQQIQNVNNNKTEFVKVYSAIVIEYKGRKEVLPFVLSTASLEFELNMRFDSLINNKRLSVYILAGNEYVSDDYNYLELLLKNSNIEVYPLAKQSLPYIEDQLENSIPLILFGTSKLSPDEARVIENFILRGGKAFIATSQYKVNIDSDWSITKNADDNFIPVLEKWGVKFEDKIANDLSNVRTSFISSSVHPDAINETNQYENINYPQWISLLPQKNIPDGITMFWASPIKAGAGVEPLFSTSNMSWTVKESKIAPDTGLFITNPFYVEKSAIEDPLFTKEQSVLGVRLKNALTGIYNFGTNENPEVIVLSDQYFALNLLLELSGGETGDFRNLDFIISSVLDLAGQTELKKMKGGGVRNSSLYKITDPLEYLKAVRKVIIWGFFVPVFFIIAAAVVLNIIRKKQNEKI